MIAEARLSVDLDALAHNFAQLRADAAGAEAAPVVKADAYGLGVGPVARRLWAEGARRFFVARLGEGEALRAALSDRQAAILVLDGLVDGAAPRMTAAGLTPVLTTLEQIDAWSAMSGLAGPLPCALHFDTGMNRLGLAVESAIEAAARVEAAKSLRPQLVISHLACAAQPDDRRNALQLQAFSQARSAFPGVPASLAASAGIYLGPDYRFDVVRPGISLYGGGPREMPDSRFRAVATLLAPVLQVRDIAAGESVGYGTMFTAPRAMRIAILGAGYADGILRALHDQGTACLNGRRAPFAIVTMDMIGVDIADCGVVRPGDMAELLGPNVLLDDVAAAMDATVAHEVLVRLSRRAEKVLIGEV